MEHCQRERNQERKMRGVVVRGKKQLRKNKQTKQTKKHCQGIGVTSAGFTCYTGARQRIRLNCDSFPFPVAIAARSKNLCLNFPPRACGRVT